MEVPQEPLLAVVVYPVVDFLLEVEVLESQVKMLSEGLEEESLLPLAFLTQLYLVFQEAMEASVVGPWLMVFTEHSLVEVEVTLAVLVPAQPQETTLEVVEVASSLKLPLT